jgi:hypothetical protein
MIHRPISSRLPHRRRLAALITGASVSGFLAVHLLHLAAASAASAAPVAWEFLCRISD